MYGTPRLPGEVLVVGHEHECRAVRLVEFPHEGNDRGAGGGIEISGWLIGKENPGRVDEGARQRHPLLLPARELRRIVRLPATKPHRREQLAGTGRVGATEELEWDQHIFHGRERWHQLEGLKDEAHALTAEASPAVLRQGVEPHAIERDVALRRLVEAGQESQQRGLSAAAGADNGQECTGLHREGDILEDGERLPARLIFPGEAFAPDHHQPWGFGILQRYLTSALVLLAAACGERSPAPSRANATTADSADTRPVIVFLGTSLTAGLGLDPSQAYPALIQQKLDSAGLAYRVVNAGVSGETSSDARARLAWLLRMNPAVLIVETGANDGLRGLSVDALRANLDTILSVAGRHQPPPRLVVIGMQAPPNLGSRYTEAFREVFPEEAAAHGAALVPFLLAGVGGVDSLNQGDGIHPTAAGQKMLAETVWRVLEGVVGRPSSVVGDVSP